MANHGILPHSGKNIPFKSLADSVQHSFNFAPTFCFFLPNYAATFLKRDFHKDTFDLSELDAHNEIERRESRS